MCRAFFIFKKTTTMKTTYQKRLSIKEWAEGERPREKMIQLGRSALSDAELIAILIRSGTPSESAVEVAKQLLHVFQHDLAALSKGSLAQLKRVKGIGEAKALSILAALELGKRRRSSNTAQLEVIDSSAKAYEHVYSKLADLDHEEFWVVLLNQANKPIHFHCISSGGVSGTVADAKLIFECALSHLACSIILCHNHPSGATRPSEADKRLTTKLAEAGKTLDISVLDHLIIGDECYFSFADEGLL